jgi:1,4-dihydroxy-2-naphthoate octaprenyltransferase
MANGGAAIGVWAKQVRAPFLLLAVLLVAIGAAAAYADGAFSWLRAGLAAAGVVLAHAAVNLFNELSDHETGIDSATKRTPFSGGSGMMQAGLTTPRAVRAAAWAALLIAAAIGLALAWVSSWWLLALMVPGGLAARFYTSHLARLMLGELVAGTTLGTFVVLGTYLAMTGALTPAVIVASIPPGILTALLLYLNEFPDVEADRAGGRRHLVIVLGIRRAAVVYALSLGAAYATVVAAVALHVLPATALIALLTAPLAVRAVVGAFRDGARPDAIVPALAANVGVVLGTDLLLAIAFLVG